MPYLLLRETTVNDVNGDGANHLAGTVLSDWEVNDYVKGKINEASLHYRATFEPLTEDQARDIRAKETAIEGDHLVDGHAVSPPWDDYVGLHPEDVISRLRETTDKGLIERVKLYEKGGLARLAILEYVPPAVRPPFHGYDDMSVSEVLDKLELVAAQTQQEVITYEMANRRRPAIITFEPEPVAAADQAPQEVTA